MNNYSKKIYFIASFGDFKKLPLGGGQTAARRLLMTLRNIGYKVEVIKRHPPTANSKLCRAIQFGFWLCVDPVLFFFRIAFRSRKDAITLYMGYLGNVLVPLELSLSFIPRVLGFKNVMYLAGGGTEKLYKRSGSFVQRLERITLNNFDLVMTEGIENMDFVKRISSASTFYLPNFVEEGFTPSTYPIKPNDRWNIMYFGRVDTVKNVLLGIDVFNYLCNKYENVSYTIVGGGPEGYCKQVEEKIASSPYKDKIVRKGRSSHEDLKVMMMEQHFYLFPSNEPREGHSNSLNEAMGFGLVPVASNNNFLPSIVGNSRLIANEMSVEAFASIIENVIISGDFELLSQEMYERVRNNFTQGIVEKNIKGKIDNLFS